MKKLIIAIALLFTVWACVPSFVSAHAYVSESSPFQDEELANSPSQIKLKFTEKIDTKLSSISLVNSKDSSSIVGELSSSGDSTLVLTIPKLDKGIYKVSWQVLSLDSHTTEGSYRFAVGVELKASKPSDTISLDGDSDKQDSTTGIGSKDQGTKDQGTKDTTATKPIETPAVKGTASEKSVSSSKPAASPNDAAAKPAEKKTESESSTITKKTSDEPTSAQPNGDALASDAETTEPTDTSNTNDDQLLTIPDSEKVPAVSATENAPTSASEHNHGGGAEYNHKGEHWFMVTLRVLDILSGVVLAGILFFRYALWREKDEAAPRGFSLSVERIVIGAAALVWILSGLARLSMLSEQFEGLSLYTIASGTMVGKVAALRPAGAILILLLAFAPVRERIWANPLKLIIVAALIVTFPLTGHAYASQNDVLVAIVAHVLHMGAAAVWFGGLLGLFSLTFYREGNPPLNQVAKRFSLWAVPSMLIIIASGIWLSAARLNDWGQLVTSEYGRLILVKSILMLLILVIAAFHKLMFMPRIEQAMSTQTNTPDVNPAHQSAIKGLKAGVRIEVLLAIGLFLFAGWLSTSSPPEDAASQEAFEPFYWHVMGEEAHMTMRVSLDKSSNEQAAKLYLWLPEEQAEPKSVVAIISSQTSETSNPSNEEITIPFALQDPVEELYEFPNFKKYTYLATGEYIDYAKKSVITIDVIDAEGNSFHFEKEIGNE